MASKADYFTDLRWEIVPMDTPDDGGDVGFVEMGLPVVAAFRSLEAAKQFLAYYEWRATGKYKIRKCPVD